MRKRDNDNSAILPVAEVITIDVIEERSPGSKRWSKAEEILSHMREMERQTQLH
jgi:hypothetical protein